MLRMADTSVANVVARCDGRDGDIADKHQQQPGQTETETETCEI